MLETSRSTKITIIEHFEIIKAIKSGDEHKSEELMKAHIQSSIELFAKNNKQQFTQQ